VSVRVELPTPEGVYVVSQAKPMLGGGLGSTQLENEPAPELRNDTLPVSA
jgi:hypothetical protein